MAVIMDCKFVSFPITSVFDFCMSFLAVRILSFGEDISRQRELRRVSTFRSMEVKVGECRTTSLTCLILLPISICGERVA
jgi:hypothetical protein